MSHCKAVVDGCYMGAHLNARCTCVCSACANAPATPGNCSSRAQPDENGFYFCERHAYEQTEGPCPECPGEQRTEGVRPAAEGMSGTGCPRTLRERLKTVLWAHKDAAGAGVASIRDDIELVLEQAPPDDEALLVKLRWLRDTVGVDIERMFARALKEKDGRDE